MIVLDASAAAELLLETATGSLVAARIRGERLHLPGHFDIEVAGVIRRAVRRELITDRAGLIAMMTLRSLPGRRWPPAAFLGRAYELRDTHSVADGVYVALAEAMNAPLVTGDGRLARSHGHHARIEEIRAPAKPE